MLDKKALKEFQTAAWTTREELRDFVQAADRIDVRELQRLLDVLTDRKHAVGASAQRNRCSAFGAIVKRSIARGFFAPLAKAIPDADDALRKTLVPLLVRANDVDQHEILCRHMGSKNPAVRAVAAEVLREIGGPSALAQLTKLVREPEFGGRMEVLEVMVPKARHRAIPLLAAVLASGHSGERMKAIKLLVHPDIASKAQREAAQAITAGFADKDRRVSGLAYRAYARLVPEDEFLQQLETRVHAEEMPPDLVEALGEFKSARSVGVVRQALRTGTAAVRMAAVEALAEIATDAIVPVLVTALHIDDAPLRRRATEVLSELSASRAIDITRAVLELLRHTTPEIRRIAAHLLKSVPDSMQLVPRLLGYLRDEDWWVRERVMDSLVGLQPEGLTEHLLPYLDDESPVVRRFAIGALIRLRNPAALGAVLKSAVQDDDWWVREQAVLATAELGDPRAIPYLHKIALERPDLRVAALDALRRFEAAEQIIDLARLASDDSADVREAVVRALAGLPEGRRAADRVRGLAGDPNPIVARKARELLESWAVALDEAEISASMGLLDRLLVAVVRNLADDLLLAAGRPPAMKRLGSVQAISRQTLDETEILGMLTPALSAAQRAALGRGEDVDFSYAVHAHGLRFRVNLFRQRTGVGAVFRHVRQDVPNFRHLGLPPVVEGFAKLAQGLVLVGGPTGAGKSTTLAAIIDHINATRPVHIVTIEDPIEVVHGRKQGLINQREVGSHTQTFDSALRSVLRQDPDVLLVGELRDLATIEFAVNAAETGHLVFATVHTASADTSIDRLIHAFPGTQQQLVRAMLAESLRAVVCQQLLRRADRPDSRILAAEVLIITEAVSNLIRKDKCFQLPTIMATQREVGMQLMDDVLEQLVRAGTVAPEEALTKAVNKNAFTTMLTADGLLDDAELELHDPDADAVFIGEPAGRPDSEPGAADISSYARRPQSGDG